MYIYIYTYGSNKYEIVNTLRATSVAASMIDNTCCRTIRSAPTQQGKSQHRGVSRVPFIR